MLSINTIKTWLMLDNDAEDENEQDIEDKYVAQEKERNPGINLCTPEHYEDVNRIAEAIENGDNALTNTRKLSAAERRRVKDFLSGLTYHREFELMLINEELIVCKALS